MKRFVETLLKAAGGAMPATDLLAEAKAALEAGRAQDAEELFSTVLSGLDPVACLNRLGALVSPHPCDLEPVQPTVDFEYLLTRFRCVAGAPGLGRPDQRAQDTTERLGTDKSVCENSFVSWPADAGTKANCLHWSG